MIYKGTLPTLLLKKSNAEVIEDAIEFAKWIVSDNDFHYGYTNKKVTPWNPNAHHNGCYFCKTNTDKGGRSKKGIVDFEHTYCCNPFAHACFAHGGCVPKALEICQRGSSWDFTLNHGYDSSPLFDKLGHPSKSKLKKGDVLCRDTHVAIYIGNGKIAEAGGEDDNKKNSKKWNDSIRIKTLTDSNYKNFPRVYRFNSSVNASLPLRHGEVSDRIKLWQSFLDWYYKKAFTREHGKVSRYFDDITLKWTKKFQKEMKITADGIIGSKTLEKAKKVEIVEDTKKEGGEKEMKYSYGIDISEHQGNIDLKPYKDKFIIIRGGYWTKTDSKAERNMNLCEKLGIPYGIYWYSYALNTSEAEKEAKACLKLIRGRNIKVGVWLDMEDADGYKRRHGFPSNKTITDMCNKFCKLLSDAKYYVGVYASESWFNSKIQSSMKYPKWIASWGANNGKHNKDLSSKCVLHQYTSKPLDKDVSYVSLDTFIGSNPKKEDTKKEDKNIIKKKAISTIAKEAIAGKWGSGDDRKKKLTKAGYDYDKVQKKVNELLKETKTTPKKKSVTTIAKEVINGKWGDGEERKKKLKKAGYDYNVIQKEVNKLLKK